MAIVYFLGWICVPGLAGATAGIVPDGGVAGRAAAGAPGAGTAGRAPGAGAAPGLAGTVPGLAAAGFASAFRGTFLSSAIWIWPQVDTYTKICDPETRSSLSKISVLGTLAIATRRVFPIL